MGEYSVRQRAYAKINLALMWGKPDRGFHEVTMIMQHVSIWDEVTISRRRIRQLPWNATYRFWEPMKKISRIGQRLPCKRLTGWSGFHIRLYKKIPIAAGMAGGSADAAGVIRGLTVCLIWAFR